MSARFVWPGAAPVCFEPPRALSDLMQMAGARADMPCGGRGQCLKCRVRASGALSAPTELEKAHLTPEEIGDGVRLACRTRALGDVWAEPISRREQTVLTQMRLAPLTLRPWYAGYGLAADIGTTTVAAYLFAPGAARPDWVASDANPQSAFGADVISRLQKSLDGQGARLREAIVGCVRRLTDELCARAGIGRAAIGGAVLTGNTAMLYLLTGRAPQSLTALPFEPDTRFGLFAPGGALGLSDEIKVYLPRCVSAYVGADISCATVAAGLFSGGAAQGDTALLADIGTNGEMVLRRGGRLYGCSTAAGPAFEGAGIEMGMNARPGAICKVWFRDGEIGYETIGGEEAAGLCGTGIVDAVAAFLDAGLIDETGRMARERVFFPGSRVALTQKDVRQVQLAKAAICAGMLTLAREAGVEANGVDRLLVAGGFGNCIDPQSAERIGLIPPGFAQKAQAIGNAAGAGAAMALLSRDALEDVEAAARACQVVELSVNPYFMEQYVERMAFE